MISFTSTGASSQLPIGSRQGPQRRPKEPSSIDRIAAKLSPPRSSSDGTAMNSANSREATMPSGSSPDAGGADSRAGRIPPAMGLQMALMAPSRLAQASFPTVRMEGTSVRGNNSISLDMTARKRSLEALSPLPSPLLTFLSPSLASSSSASALSLPNTMNQYDLSSSRPQKMNPVGSLQAIAVGNNSLKFVVPSGVKRVRRDAPSSPCSVGEVTANAAGSASVGPSPSPASRPVAPPPASSDKIRSVVRGLEHVSRCSPSGCGNPLCVSTRGFMNKVSAHLVAMANKPGHVAERCGACQLWHSIVRSHASICMEVDCSIPLCSSANEKPDGGAVESSSSGCRPRDRRDDNDDQRRSLVAQQ